MEIVAGEVSKFIAREVLVIWWDCVGIFLSEFSQMSSDTYMYLKIEYNFCRVGFEMFDSLQEDSTTCAPQ